MVIELEGVLRIHQCQIRIEGISEIGCEPYILAPRIIVIELKARNSEVGEIGECLTVTGDGSIRGIIRVVFVRNNIGNLVSCFLEIPRCGIGKAVDDKCCACGAVKGDRERSRVADFLLIRRGTIIGIDNFRCRVHIVTDIGFDLTDKELFIRDFVRILSRRTVGKYTPILFRIEFLGLIRSIHRIGLNIVALEDYQIKRVASGYFLLCLNFQTIHRLCIGFRDRNRKITLLHIEPIFFKAIHSDRFKIFQTDCKLIVAGTALIIIFFRNSVFLRDTLDGLNICECCGKRHQVYRIPCILRLGIERRITI